MEALALVERELQRPDIIGPQRTGLDRAARYLRRAIELERAGLAHASADGGHARLKSAGYSSA